MGLQFLLCIGSGLNLKRQELRDSNSQLEVQEIITSVQYSPIPNLAPSLPYLLLPHDYLLSSEDRRQVLGSISSSNLSQLLCHCSSVTFVTEILEVSAGSHLSKYPVYPLPHTPTYRWEKEGSEKGISEAIFLIKYLLNTLVKEVSLDTNSGT